MKILSVLLPSRKALPLSYKDQKVLCTSEVVNCILIIDPNVYLINLACLAFGYLKNACANHCGNTILGPFTCARNRSEVHSVQRSFVKTQLVNQLPFSLFSFDEVTEEMSFDRH